MKKGHWKKVTFERRKFIPDYEYDMYGTRRRTSTFAPDADDQERELFLKNTKCCTYCDASFDTFEQMTEHIEDAQCEDYNLLQEFNERMSRDD
jgi:hypothetical protein